MLVKTVSSEEARTHLRDVMDEVAAGEAEIVIERHGKPMVAVISYKEYQRLQNERAQQAIDQRKGAQPDLMWLTASNQFDACYAKPA